MVFTFENILLLLFKKKYFLLLSLLYFNITLEYLTRRAESFSSNPKFPSGDAETCIHVQPRFLFNANRCDPWPLTSRLHLRLRPVSPSNVTCRKKKLGIRKKTSWNAGSAFGKWKTWKFLQRRPSRSRACRSAARSAGGRRKVGGRSRSEGVAWRNVERGRRPIGSHLRATGFLGRSWKGWALHRRRS